MKDFYIVTHQTGAGGAFLNALIYSWLTNIDISSTEFDDYGSAHVIGLEGLPVTNHQNQSCCPVTGKHSSMDASWKWLKAVDTSIPLCVRSHILIDETINDFYPNYQHFHIFTTPEDYEIMSFNYALKVSFGFDPDTSIAMLSEENLQLKMEYYYQKFVDSYHDHTDDIKHWFEPYDHPNTVNILYKDMMTNPNKVHQQLEEILGPMPTFIKTYHNNYINKNIELVQTHAPWITYYETVTW